MTLPRPCANMRSRQNVWRKGEGNVGWGLPTAARDAARFPVCRRGFGVSPVPSARERRGNLIPRTRHQMAGPDVHGSLRAPCLRRGEAYRFDGRSPRRTPDVAASNAWERPTPSRISVTFESQQHKHRHLAPGSFPARTQRGSQPVQRSHRQSTRPVDSPTRRNAPRPFAIEVSSSSGGPPTTYRASCQIISSSPCGTWPVHDAGMRNGSPLQTTTLPKVLGRRCSDALASCTRASTRQVAVCL